MHGCIPVSSKQTVLQSDETSEKFSPVLEKITPGTSLSTSSKLPEPQSQRVKTEHRQCECCSVTKGRCLPFSQNLFLLQLIVVFILDAFCLLKLICSHTEADTRQSRESSINSCHDTSIYMSVLSSTLAYLFPPPRVPAKIQKAKACQLRGQQNQIATKHFGSSHDQFSSRETFGESSTPFTIECEKKQVESEDIPDSVDLAVAAGQPWTQNKQSPEDKIRPSDNRAAALQDDPELWLFFKWQVDRNLFIFSCRFYSL